MSRQQYLAGKPVSLVDAKVTTPDDGGVPKLEVPLRQGRISGWLFKLPAGSTKKFEMDDMGVFVWNSCDGRTSIQQIIRKLSKRYSLSEREAAVSTEAFLRTLMRKGLIGVSPPGGAKRSG